MVCTSSIFTACNWFTVDDRQRWGWEFNNQRSLDHVHWFYCSYAWFNNSSKSNVRFSSRATKTNRKWIEEIVGDYISRDHDDRANDLTRRKPPRRKVARERFQCCMSSCVSKCVLNERRKTSGRVDEKSLFFNATRYNYQGLVTFAKARIAVKYLVDASPGVSFRTSASRRVASRRLGRPATRRLPQSGRFAYSTNKQRKCRRSRRRKRRATKDKENKSKLRESRCVEWPASRNCLSQRTWTAEFAKRKHVRGITRFTLHFKLPRRQRISRLESYMVENEGYNVERWRGTKQNSR